VALLGWLIGNNKIVYYQAAGHNNINAKTAMHKDDIFTIAQQKKPLPV